MLESLDLSPPDPILGLTAAFRADHSPAKIDLGVGVYRDDQGVTPVFQAVSAAEEALLARQTTKTYVSPVGNAGFNQAMERLLLGEAHPALTAGRVSTIQAPGGCGALRLGAELIKRASPDSVVYVSTPTWANHIPLLSGCGLRLERYPYFDASTGGVDFVGMQDALDALPARSVVLLHACCHNPTGADLTQSQWRELLLLFKRRALFPFIDIAYQGLASSMTEDAFGTRLFCAELPEVTVATSCSKNFGLYRERTGALHVLANSATATAAALSHLVQVARTLYSMPPDHGAEIVHQILTDDRWRQMWIEELASMRARIHDLRHALVQSLARECPQRSFEFITTQQGMFTYLGIDPAQVRQLRKRHHVYMTADARINIAGLSNGNLDYFSRAIADVLHS